MSSQVAHVFKNADCLCADTLRLQHPSTSKRWQTPTQCAVAQSIDSCAKIWWSSRSLLADCSHGCTNHWIALIQFGGGNHWSTKIPFKFQIAFLVDTILLSSYIKIIHSDLKCAFFTTQTQSYLYTRVSSCIMSMPCMPCYQHFEKRHRAVLNAW